MYMCVFLLLNNLYMFVEDCHLIYILLKLLTYYSVYCSLRIDEFQLHNFL